MECKQQHLFPITHSNKDKNQTKKIQKTLKCKRWCYKNNKKSKILSWNTNDGWNSLPTDIPSASWHDLKETPPNRRRGREFGAATLQKKMCMSKVSFLVEAVFFFFFNSLFFLFFSFRFQLNSGWNVLPSKSLQLIWTKKKKPRGPSWWRCPARFDK